MQTESSCPTPEILSLKAARGPTPPHRHSPAASRVSLRIQGCASQQSLRTPRRGPGTAGVTAGVDAGALLQDSGPSTGTGKGLWNEPRGRDPPRVHRGWAQTICKVKSSLVAGAWTSGWQALEHKATRVSDPCSGSDSATDLFAVRPRPRGCAVSTVWRTQCPARTACDRPRQRPGHWSQSSCSTVFSKSHF